MKLLMTMGLVCVMLSLGAGTARAECDCLAIAADVSAAVQAEVARADLRYARGDYDGALAGYARAYQASGDAVLLYAQGMAQWHVGATADARASFQRYLASGGELAYRARVEASLDDLGAGVAATASGVLGGVRGAGGAVRGATGAVRGGAGVDLAGELRGATAKPKKVAKGAAIVLAVVAVVAVGAVAVQGISAGIDEDIDFDKRFGLGMGLSGVVVGATAVYLWGLTAAVGAAGGVCAADAGKPVVVPQLYRGGGGGLAAAMRF